MSKYKQIRGIKVRIVPNHPILGCQGCLFEHHFVTLRKYCKKCPGEGFILKPIRGHHYIYTKTVDKAVCNYLTPCKVYQGKSLFNFNVIEIVDDAKVAIHIRMDDMSFHTETRWKEL